MKALTTREALGSALRDAAQRGIDAADTATEYTASGIAVEVLDNLLASGVVVDAATLADDEALIGGWDSGVAGAVADAMIEHGPDGHVDGYEEITRAALRALAAAITERGAR